MESATSVKLVHFDELWHAFPRVGKIDLGKELGGQLPVILEGLTDDSTIRLSSAFNRTGHPLPISTLHSGHEIHDKDGFKYIASHSDMRAFLSKKLGKPKHCKDMTSVLGKRGIIMFDEVESLPERTHFDLWATNGETADTFGDYWTESKNVQIWIIE